jgi:hypothetical protein
MNRACWVMTNLRCPRGSTVVSLLGGSSDQWTGFIVRSGRIVEIDILADPAELSPRTFCIFQRELSSPRRRSHVGGRLSFAKTGAPISPIDFPVGSTRGSRMLTALIVLLRSIGLICRGHRATALEDLALRQQVAVLRRTVTRPHLRSTDRLFWILLAKVGRDWRSALIVVQPDTVVRWHRQWLRRRWTRRSERRRTGRPTTDSAIRAPFSRSGAGSRPCSPRTAAIVPRETGKVNSRLRFPSEKAIESGD